MLPYFVYDTISIGPLTLHTWGLFAGLAFAAALYVALKEAKRKNISKEAILDLAILILVGGFAGARLAYVAENWKDYSGNLFQIFRLSEGGLMFYGGATGAAILFFAYVKFISRRLIRLGREKLSFGRIADTLASSFAIGEFIGRIGCSITDLHIGFITMLPWGQKYIDDSIRHPVAIYMSLNGLIMFAALWFLRLRIKMEGALFLFFILWYSGTRFFLDFLRCNDLEECDPHYFGFTPSQYISVLIFLTALIILIKKTKIMEELKKQAQESAGEKFETKDAAGEIKLEMSHDNANVGGREKTKAPQMKKYLAGIIATIIGFTVGAGLLSGFYERFFKKDIFSFRGKTWVSYDKPMINLTIINDASCKECATEKLTKQLKGGIMPTLVIKEIDYNSKEGKDAISKFSIKSLPALIFDNGVEKLDNFNQLSQVLINKDSRYYLNSVAAGIKPGKFLEPLPVLANDRVKGPADAPITIIEFSDFQCPYCKGASQVIKQVLAAYPDKIRFVFKHFPLTQIHANAQYAAESAECAGDQGKFWEMNDLLFTNQDKLDKASISKYASQLKLNKTDFDGCFTSGKSKPKIEADAKVATDYGVGGTPAFFINGQLLDASPTLDSFKAMIDEQLKSK